jgi:hypothetical protein
MTNKDFIAEAYDESKLGGNMERAKVLATLAIAQAIQDLASEVCHLTSDANPLHIQVSQ